MKGYDGLGSLKNRTALATFFGKKERRIAAFFTNILSYSAYCRPDLQLRFGWMKPTKGKLALGSGEKGELNRQC